MRVIVGNGPSVLKRKNGSLINNADMVVRIGKYITEGFEEYVGSKTDYWFSLTNDRRERKDVTKITISVSEQSLRTKHWISMIKRSTVEAAYRYAEIPLDSNFRPTLGLLTVAQCILAWGWKKVYITGFDHCRPGQRKHYWEPEEKVGYYKYHREKFERQFMENFILSGLVERL